MTVAITAPSSSIPAPRGPVVRIALERAIASDANEGARREWLCTTGWGDYAMGTACGLATRRYHGLLIGASRAPIGRRMLVPFIDEELILRDNHRVALASRRWEDGSIDPDGQGRIAGFALEDGTPTWTLESSGVQLERRVIMLRDQRGVAVVWSLAASSAPCKLEARLFVAHRGHHQCDPDAQWLPTVATSTDGHATIVLPANRLVDSPTTLHLAAPADSTMSLAGTWWRRHALRLERERGYDAIDSACHAVTVALDLEPGETRAFVVGLDPSIGQTAFDGEKLLTNERTRRHALLTQAAMLDASSEVQSLALAADDFIVRRQRRDGSQGRSIIAGFPWFEDWGRDAMLALPGLLLSTRRFTDAKLVLETFLEHCCDGLIPNRFPDEGMEPEYHSADAALLTIVATKATAEASKDWPWMRRQLPTLLSIVDAFATGTRHGIRVDTDGLICAGENGLQLTWMDAKVGDLVVTPRMGKPIELQALWIAALDALALVVADDPRYAAREDELRAWSGRATRALARYWNSATKSLKDVVDGPAGDDETLRPNQLFLLAHCSAIPQAWRDAALQSITRELRVSLAVRTLGPRSDGYRGRYEGDQRARDFAYHNGTAWPFLAGLLLRAESLREGGMPTNALRDLHTALSAHLRDGGLGSVSEIVDGDAPHTPRGCPMQAWSVGCILEALTSARSMGA